MDVEGADEVFPLSFLSLIPRHDLRHARRLLFVAPHPDDAAVAAGATLARLVAAGAQVRVLDLTSGETGTPSRDVAPGDLARLREEEERASLAILGVEEVTFGRLPDFGLGEKDVRAAVMPAVREMHPDVLMMPDPWTPYEAHPDHRAAGLGAVSALLAAGLSHVLPEAGPGVAQPAAAFYATDRPNAFVPAEGFWEKKIAALGAHRSQFPAEMVPLYAGYFAERSEAMPGGPGPKEAFRVLDAYFLHMNPDGAGDV